MSTTITMAKQSTSSSAPRSNNPYLFLLKKIITAIHFATLMGIFISVIVYPANCHQVIIAAAVTLVLAIMIPPRGMLKPDEAAPHWLEKNEQKKD